MNVKWVNELLWIHGSLGKSVELGQIRFTDLFQASQFTRLLSSVLIVWVTRYAIIMCVRNRAMDVLCELVDMAYKKSEIIKGKPEAVGRHGWKWDLRMEVERK